MKKNLFLVMTALIMIACGSDDEKTLESFTNNGDEYFSKDSIHTYVITNRNNIDFLHKMKRNGETIWEKSFVKPNPETIDLGYGEVEKLDYNLNKVVLDTDKYLYTLSMIGSYKYTDFFQIGKYSINGDFIEIKKIDLNYTQIPKCIETYDKNILIILGGAYAILNLELNVIDYKKISLDLLKHTKFIRKNQYITYDDKEIFLIKIEDNNKINIDLKAFISASFPNEENMPKYTISNVKTNSDYVDILLEITLYNGENKTLKGRFSYDSGELII